MKIIEVIESKQWKNIKTGATASIYGAVPYTSETDKESWTVESRGFTWRLENGTIGLGRQPAKTRDEAVEIMNKINERREVDKLVIYYDDSRLNAEVCIENMQEFLETHAEKLLNAGWEVNQIKGNLENILKLLKFV